MGVRQLFDTVVTSFELGWRKPNPAAYRAVMRELGADPGAAHFVGDTYRADRLGAIRAGIRALLIDPPRRLPYPQRRVCPRCSRSPPAWRNSASPRPAARARPSPAAPARRVRPSAPGRSGAAARPRRLQRHGQRRGERGNLGQRVVQGRQHPQGLGPVVPGVRRAGGPARRLSRTGSAVSRSSLRVSVSASAIRCLTPLATAPPGHIRRTGGSGPRTGEGRHGTTGATERTWTCPSGGSRRWRRSWTSAGQDLGEVQVHLHPPGHPGTGSPDQPRLTGAARGSGVSWSPTKRPPRRAGTRSPRSTSPPSRPCSTASTPRSASSSAAT
ncbi:HAD family hydrolase [Streptomyces sp. CS227]|uniref:HAD family hydrolase n=1 Tax=Streptomyces sp. CS227 TaxID=1982763 RepID=UPI00359C188B